MKKTNYYKEVNIIKNIELKINNLEIRASENNNHEMIVSGYVNKTNELSEVLGSDKKFREKVNKGVFKRAIKNAKNIDFLIEHDNKMIAASTSNDSLKLIEDDEGLYMEAKLVNTSYVRDYYELIKTGIVKHMSFGMRNIKSNWEIVKGITVRTITELDLVEVSAVRMPAYAQTNISARGIDVDDVEVPDYINEEEPNMENIEELAELIIGLDTKINKISAVVEELVNDKYEKDNSGEEETLEVEEAIEEVVEEESEEVVEVVEEAQEEAIEKDKKIESEEENLEDKDKDKEERALIITNELKSLRTMLNNLK